MASDETTPPEGPKPVERPQRDRHREPPIIEGEAERLSDPSGGTGPLPHGTNPVEPPVSPAEPVVEEPLGVSPAGAEPRRGVSAALPVAFVALLLSGGSAYYAWQQQGSAAPQVASSDLDALRSRLDGLERSASRPTATPEQLAALDARLKAVEQRPVPQAAPSATRTEPAPASGPDLTALQTRIDSIERLAKQAAAAAADRPPPPAPAPAAPPPPRVDLGPLEGRIAALEEKSAGPKTQVRATEDPVDAPRKGDPTALAVVAQALSSAVGSGRPFPMEMAAAEALGAEPAKLASLKPLAATGAPSLEAVRRAFAQTSARMLAAAEPAAGSDTLVDKLRASATRLVRVRPVGDATGEDGPALVARIDAATARGDAAAALRDWTRLPDAARAESAALGDLLRRKVEAETAAQTILDGAMAALARPKD